MTERSAPRWVLDIKVVLSALIRPGGVAGRLRLAWQARLFVPLASRDTVAELMRVFAYPKFKLTRDAQHDLLADYLPWTQAVRIPDPPPNVPRSRDPHDAPFLKLAFAAKADAVITGDADLHALAPLRRIALFTPAQAVQALSQG